MRAEDAIRVSSLAVICPERILDEICSFDYHELERVGEAAREGLEATMKGGILASAILLVATGASAAAPAETGTPAASAATDTQAETADERKICRTEKVTGSLSRRSRVCLTAAQWREVHDRTRRGVDEMNSAASGGKVCHPDPGDPFQGCPG